MFDPYIDTYTAVDLYTWVNKKFKEISGFNKEYVIDCDLFLKIINRLNCIPAYSLVGSFVSTVFPNLNGYKTTITNYGASITVSINEDTVLSNKVIDILYHTKNTGFDVLTQEICDGVRCAVAKNNYFRLLKQFIDDPKESLQTVVYKLLTNAFFNFTTSRSGASGCMINDKWFSIIIDRQAEEDTALGVYVAYDGMSLFVQNFTDATYREF